MPKRAPQYLKESFSRSEILVSVFRALSALLPDDGRSDLREATSMYMQETISVGCFAETIKLLADRYQVVIPYTDDIRRRPWRDVDGSVISGLELGFQERPKRRSPEGGHKVLRAKSKWRKSLTVHLAAVPGSFSKEGKSQVECAALKLCPEVSGSEAISLDGRACQAWTNLKPSQTPIASSRGSMALPPIMAASLAGSRLAEHLTEQIANALGTNVVTVKIIGEVKSLHSGLPRRTKAVMVCQKFVMTK